MVRERFEKYMWININTCTLIYLPGTTSPPPTHTNTTTNPKFHDHEWESFAPSPTQKIPQKTKKKGVNITKIVDRRWGRVFYIPLGAMMGQLWERRRKRGRRRGRGGKGKGRRRGEGRGREGERLRDLRG